MRYLRKLLLITMMEVMVLGLFGFTGCSFFKSTNESQGFSLTRLEKLEDTVDTVVEDYFMEKYGVEATVTYKNVAGNVFLGPDPSSVQYYNVTVNIADGDIVNKYYVEVHGRETEGTDELYVKSDAYYGYLIKEKMEKWLDGYMSNTNIREYYILYKFTETNQFPNTYEITATAEEIIQSVSSIENIKERPSLPLYVFIPESEYDKNHNIESEFSEIRKYVNEINGKITVSLNVYSDDDYLKKINNEQSEFKLLNQIKIIT